MQERRACSVNPGMFDSIWLQASATRFWQAADDSVSGVTH
jgi:hypothetical protein